jgi:hypothetical protein
MIRVLAYSCQHSEYGPQTLTLEPGSKNNNNEDHDLDLRFTKHLAWL